MESSDRLSVSTHLVPLVQQGALLQKFAVLVPARLGLSLIDLAPAACPLPSLMLHR